MGPVTAQDIICQQVLMEDATVYSRQWMTLPGGLSGMLSPRFLLERYLAYIRTWTLGIVRPIATADGGLEFRLLGTGLSLIRFSGESFQDTGDGTELVLRISGGVLVQQGECGRGEMSLAVEPTADGTTVSLRLADYCPLLLGGGRPSRLRKLLYRFTQAYIHRLVTVNFLADCYRELAGRDANVRVVRRRLRGMEEI
jgi:hypothetical protein